MVHTVHLRAQTLLGSLFQKRTAFLLSFRGTARSPGADPTRLPTGLDLRAISIVEGVRAGLAAAAPIAASVWLNQPALSLTALGALLTCICDPGGPLRRRLPLQLGFVLVASLCMGGFGLVRGAGIAATVLAAAPALFCTSFVRVWGAPFAAVGNLVAVALLLGTDISLDPTQALLSGALFAAGGAWALLLTLILWRLHPFGPARRSVADVWDALSRMARMMLLLLEQEEAGRPHSEAGWESQARAGRGATRDAIERSRAVLMDTFDARGPASGPAAQNLMRLEAADQLLGVMTALSDQLEHWPARQRPPAIAMLRRVPALLRVLAEATERETAEKLPKLERAIDAMLAEAAAVPGLLPAARGMAESLRAATRLIDPAQYLPGSGVQGDAGVPWRQRVAGPALANWTWRSASLRHAVRVCLVVSLALGATLLHHGPYTHWLTITLVLVMQPLFAATWQRTLERVGGTLFGGVLAALLSTLTHSRLQLAGLLPVLGALALAVRQVSYGVYIAVYTPLVVLLVEQVRPLEDQRSIALARAGFTVLGGLIAVAANALLWPSWQPAQVAADLASSLRAHAAYAQSVLFPAGGGSARERRQAGLASNNLEASLQRAMHEPRRGQRDRLQAVLVADATLRRIAGRLAAISLDKQAADAQQGAWVVETLQALQRGEAAAPRPVPSGAEQLDRLMRQVELLGKTLVRGEEKQAVVF